MLTLQVPSAKVTQNELIMEINSNKFEPSALAPEFKKVALFWDTLYENQAQLQCFGGNWLML